MRWSAVFAGTVLAIGLWILLQVLGMGIGLSAVDTDDAGNLRSIGIGTGIWSIIAPLIAIFLGALLAGRLSGALDRKVGGMHGSVVWALALIVGLWSLMNFVQTVAGGVARVGTAAASAGGAVVSTENIGGAASALGIDASDLVAPINQRLQSEGKPPITADQLDATMKAVAQRGLKQGELDRQVIVEELAQNTALSRSDAQEVAAEIEKRYGKQLQQLGQGAKSAALTAADRTGKALVAGGVMMLLSLIAGVAGGALGVPRRRAREDVVVPPTTVPPTTVTTTDREPPVS